MPRTRLCTFSTPHLTLSELSEENEEKFRNVTDCLKEELERQKDK